MRSAAGSAGVLAIALALAAWVLRRKVAVVTIAGESMSPTYSSGDRVLVRRTRLGSLRRGVVVVIERPTLDGRWHTPPIGGSVGSRDWMIKRVVALPGDPWPDGSGRGPAEPFGRAVPAGAPVPAGYFAVHGDNPAGSFDSRVFGYCPADRLLGVVVRSMRR
jgi:signal peptidase I